MIIFAENQKQVDKDDIEKEYDQRRAGIGSAAVLAQRCRSAADGRGKHLHRRVADGVRLCSPFRRTGHLRGRIPALVTVEGRSEGH